MGVSRPPVSDEELHCRLFRGVNRCRIGINVWRNHLTHRLVALIDFSMA